MEEPKVVYPNFKTHILLPVIFILTLVVAICFIAIDDFTEGLGNIIVWFYFGVVIAYCVVAIVDLKLNKDRTRKMRTFIITMLVLTFIAAILYATFFIIGRR